jgi:hypothetical protein
MCRVVVSWPVPGEKIKKIGGFWQKSPFKYSKKGGNPVGNPPDIRKMKNYFCR